MAKAPAPAQPSEGLSKETDLTGEIARLSPEDVQILRARVDEADAALERGDEGVPLEDLIDELDQVLYGPLSR